MFDAARLNMIDSQIRPSDVTEPQILAALGAVAREGFVPTAVVVHVIHGAMPVRFPSLVVAMLVLALPCAGALVVAAASGVLLRVRPVRISTMTFD